MLYLTRRKLPKYKFTLSPVCENEVSREWESAWLELGVTGCPRRRCFDFFSQPIKQMHFSEINAAVYADFMVTFTLCSSFKKKKKSLIQAADVLLSHFDRFIQYVKITRSVELSIGKMPGILMHSWQMTWLHVLHVLFLMWLRKHSRQYSRVAKSFLKNTVNARQCEAWCVNLIKMLDFLSRHAVTQGNRTDENPNSVLV